MALAEIHGKTPYGYFEDILTADVFGAFRYLPAKQGIIGFLRSIPGLDAKIPLPDENSTCEIFFWPRRRLRGREPDVLLELVIRDQVLHVVVEAKYTAGLGDHRDFVREVDGELKTFGKQLVDEFRDLQHGAYSVERGLRGQRHILLRSASHDRFLLYLTAHLTEPTDDLEQARSQVPEAADRIFWSSWYQVYDHLVAAREALVHFPYRQIVDDTCTLLDIKGFSSFQGIRQPPSIVLDGVSGSFWRLSAKHLEDNALE